MNIKVNKFNFVRKAETTKPMSLKSPTSRLGMERPQHKYIKRVNRGDGTFKYIYEESSGKKSPSSKDNEMMIQEFRNAMIEDKKYKKFVKYFDLPVYNNVALALDMRGEEVTPESFIKEMTNAEGILGVKVSPYLPTSSAAREYKNLFAEAGDRPSSYNKKIMGMLNSKAKQYE
jgi:hypothetical protein